MKIGMDGCALEEIIGVMAILIEDAVAGAVILGAYAPDIGIWLQVFPYIFGHIVLPTKEIDAITLTDSAYRTIIESDMTRELDAIRKR